MLKYLLFALSATAVLFLSAKDADSRLKVFVDCPTCDQSYLSKEIGYVDFVRDRAFSDVQVLVQQNFQPNGAVAMQFKFFATNGDCVQTFTKVLDPNVTKDEERKFVKRYLIIGILPLLSNSNIIDQFTVQYNAPEGLVEVPMDPWKNWTFRMNFGGYANGQSAYKSFNTWSSVNVSKIEEDWKFAANLGQNNRGNSYQIDGETVKSSVRSYYGNLSMIIGLNDHWSYGLFANARSSSYSNLLFSSSFSPSIEYNFFSYADFNEKQLRLNYQIGPLWNQYYESTIYGKMDELLYTHAVSLQANFVQKWGQLSSRLSANQYLHDPELYSVSLYNSVSWNVFKGFALNVSGNFSIINDQISLPGEEITGEEILLSQRAQSTSYSFWTNVGITYSFGSKFSNIVNPRFGV